MEDQNAVETEQEVKEPAKVTQGQEAVNEQEFPPVSVPDDVKAKEQEVQDAIQAPEVTEAQKDSAEQGAAPAPNVTETSSAPVLAPKATEAPIALILAPTLEPQSSPEAQDTPADSQPTLQVIPALETPEAPADGSAASAPPAEEIEEETPTWSGIPIIIKEKILRKMSYKTRFRLRVCSKKDRDLVDNAPISFTCIRFEAFLGIDRRLAGCELTLSRRGCLRDTTINGLEAINHFANIFNRPRANCENLSFDNGYLHMENSPMKLLLLKFKSMGPEFKIRAKNVNILRVGNREYFYLELFKVLHPDYIYDIKHMQLFSIEGMQKLAETEAFRNAKSIRCRQPQSMPIDWVLNAEKIDMVIRTLTGEDIQKLIDRFTMRERLKAGHGFTLMTGSDLVVETIPSVDAPQVPERDHRDLHPHIQRFPTSSPDLVFILKLGSSQVAGYVCRTLHQDADFKRFLRTGLGSFQNMRDRNGRDYQFEATPPTPPPRHEDSLNLIDPNNPNPVFVPPNFNGPPGPFRRRPRAVQPQPAPALFQPQPARNPLVPGQRYQPRYHPSMRQRPPLPLFYAVDLAASNHDRSDPEADRAAARRILGLPESPPRPLTVPLPSNLVGVQIPEAEGPLPPNAEAVQEPPRILNIRDLPPGAVLRPWPQRLPLPPHIALQANFPAHMIFQAELPVRPP
uniref:F-box domain-containing protein n=1 Tax=Caenorhabditis tropicalis TaxID=1561998 RepID=A0A1I7V249_9PELO